MRTHAQFLFGRLPRPHVPVAVKQPSKSVRSQAMGLVPLWTEPSAGSDHSPRVQACLVMLLFRWNSPQVDRAAVYPFGLVRFPVSHIKGMGDHAGAGLHLA